MEAYKDGEFAGALASLLDAEPDRAACVSEILFGLRQKLGLTDAHFNQVGPYWLKRACEIREEYPEPGHVAETAEAGANAVNSEPDDSGGPVAPPTTATE